MRKLLKIVLKESLSPHEESRNVKAIVKVQGT